jgi:ABC-type phosphate/phosphonate transport system substrate-binding protein
MIASLGMYDPRWLHAANNTVWAAIAARLRAVGMADVPDTLTRDRPLDTIWNAPDCLLAQTCGYPLTTRLGRSVAVVATPIHAADGCEGAWHRSALVVRRNDPAPDLAALAGRTAAINARDSNTGMNLLRAAVAPFAQAGRFFGSVIETGAHARSLCAVIARHADIAAIDAVTLALLRDRYPGIDRRIRILGWTAATPGLPLITAARQSVAALRTALDEALADRELAPTLAALRLRGITVLDRSAYDSVLALENEAIRAGYPALA